MGIDKAPAGGPPVNVRLPAEERIAGIAERKSHHDMKKMPEDPVLQKVLKGLEEMQEKIKAEGATEANVEAGLQQIAKGVDAVLESMPDDDDDETAAAPAPAPAPAAAPVAERLQQISKGFDAVLESMPDDEETAASPAPAAAPVAERPLDDVVSSINGNIDALVGQYDNTRATDVDELLSRLGLQKHKEGPTKPPPDFMVRGLPPVEDGGEPPAPVPLASLEQANLVAAEPALAVGARVRVAGLVKAADLNGCLGAVVALPKRGGELYGIRLEGGDVDGRTIACRAENVVLMPPAVAIAS